MGFGVVAVRFAADLVFWVNFGSGVFSGVLCFRVLILFLIVLN